LHSVYVKTFAKFNDETVKFLKDGYTDFRGNFSYAETNSVKLQNIKNVAILVKSDEFGCVTKEVKPPQNIQNEVSKDMEFLTGNQLKSLAKKKQKF